MWSDWQEKGGSERPSQTSRCSNVTEKADVEGDTAIAS